MRLTRSLRPLVAVALFPLGLVACSGNSRPQAYDVPVSVDDVTTTHVLNTNAFPVTVYLVKAGMNHRLGVVESMSAGLFEVPSRLMTGRREFRLVASPLGPHPTHVSELFMLQPGQSASWRVNEATSRAAQAISLVSVRSEQSGSINLRR
jgi:hypothetical protein